MSIADNLSSLHDQIADACRRANRSAGDVALMAVSKMHPAEAILEAHAAGQRLFGETSGNKPMRLVDTKTIGDGLVFLTYQPVRDA